MIAWALLLVVSPAQAPTDATPPPQGVVVKSEEFPEAHQWDAVAASPRISGSGGELGTAVVVGIKEGTVYLLTANHVVSGSGERTLEFFTRDTYADHEKLKGQVLTGADVALRIAKADVALLKVNLGKQPAPKVLKVPKPWDRPRQFPVTALSVGCDDAKPPTCRVEQILAKQLVRRSSDLGAFYWNTANAPVPGRSGGPLIDKQGRLIGICAAAQKSAGYFSHLDEIHAGLKQEGYAWIWESVGAR